MSDGQVKIGVDLDSSSLDGDLSKAKSKLEKAAAGMRDVMQGPVAALELVGQAFNAVSAEVTEMTAAYASQASADAILEAAVSATGASSWTTTKALQAQASALQELTGYSDDSIESMQAVLLGFKNIKGVNFDSAVENVLDMATVMKMNLSSAAQAVGKALDDPVGGLDSLSRQGFKFTDAEKAMNKEMVRTGDIAGAQRVVLDALATTFGGSSKAAWDAATSEQKLAISTGELYEVLGKLISNGIGPLQENVSGMVKDFTAWAVENDNLENTLRVLGTTVAIVAIGFTSYMVVMQGAAVVKAFTTAMLALNVAMTANPIGMIALGVTALLVAINFVAEAIGGWPVVFMYVKKAGLMLADGIAQVFTGMVATVTGAVNAIIKAYNAVVTTLGGKPIKLFDQTNLSLTLGITKALSDVNQEIKDGDKAAQDASKKRAQSYADAQAQIAAHNASLATETIAQNAVTTAVSATGAAYAPLTRADAAFVAGVVAGSETSVAAFSMILTPVQALELGIKAVEVETQTMTEKFVESSTSAIAGFSSFDGTVQLLNESFQKLGSDVLASTAEMTSEALKAMNDLQAPIAKLIATSGADVWSWVQVGVVAINLVADAWDIFWGKQTKAQKEAKKKRKEDRKDIEDEARERLMTEEQLLQHKWDQEVKAAKKVGADVTNINAYYAQEQAKIAADAAQKIRDEWIKVGDTISSAITGSLKSGDTRDQFKASIMELLQNMAIDAVILATGFAQKFEAIGKFIKEALVDGFSQTELDFIDKAVMGLYDEVSSAVNPIKAIFAAKIPAVSGPAPGSSPLSNSNIIASDFSSIARAPMTVSAPAGLSQASPSTHGHAIEITIKPTTVEMNGRAVGRIVWENQDYFQGAAYGN